jgi:cation diffusion facilitator CzcD-associated flavoprotein CzcO
VQEQAKVADRAPVRNTTLDAVVVGAGFGGMYMVHRLREAGYAVQGVEAGGDVGGTWYWNRYPGARCDIPSLMYSYSWSDELVSEWTWSERYAPQPEILSYANHVADRFDIRDAYLFDTRVLSAKYDDAADRWTIETNRGDVITARFCVMATGCLSAPRDPDIKGYESFKGEAYITGLWPHEPVDFKGKRVAMIGTGSSAIQSTPLIAQDAAQVTVFQRTPNFSLPARNRPIGEQELVEFRANFPMYREMLKQGGLGIALPETTPSDDELRALAGVLWSGDGLLSLVAFPNLTRDEHVNAIAAEYVRDRIKEIVQDPKIAYKLTPKDYPLGTKRACVDTDYYATFNRDNVELVDLRETPIVEITPTGVRTSAGDFPVDVIVYATGFDAMTGAMLRIDIRGRDGLPLRDAWAAGPRTYLGLQIAGFPNLFTITGPGSPSVLSNMITSCEQHVDWIMDALGYMKARDLKVMEAKPEAQEAWVAHCNDEANQTLFPKANSWYIGANVPGKPRVFMPYVGQGYKIRVDKIAANGYEGFALSA